jgi:uncharacterized protein (UPF0333 family)
MLTTRAAKGQASLSFLLTFAAVVAVVAILFAALLHISKETGNAISGLGLKSECAEQAAEYAIWESGFPGLVYMTTNSIMLNEKGAYMVCAKENITWGEYLERDNNEKGWE